MVGLLVTSKRKYNLTSWIIPLDQQRGITNTISQHILPQKTVGLVIRSPIVVFKRLKWCCTWCILQFHVNKTSQLKNRMAMQNFLSLNSSSITQRQVIGARDFWANCLYRDRSKLITIQHGVSSQMRHIYIYMCTYVYIEGEAESILNQSISFTPEDSLLVDWANCRVDVYMLGACAISNQSKGSAQNQSLKNLIN